jgi:signal transduction histidine kinase
MQERVASAMDNEFRYPDGVTRHFELHIEPCDQGVVVLSIDVTEGRKTEAQLRHAQKMEAVGRLAGSVAHDFNNLLSVILGYSSMLLMDLKPVDPIRGDIDMIRLAGEKAAALTRQLLAFSRQQVLAPRVLDLNEVVQSSESMLRRLLGEDVQLVMLYDRNLSHVRVDPGQIDQVVMNLALNARDAMPDGGRLRISGQRETGVTSLPSLDPREYVRMTVTDTGIGMDETTLKRCSEPFFTTKEVGRGTGLGLSTVHGLAVQSGGGMRISSRPGDGTTVELWFPVAEGVARWERAQAAQVPSDATPRYRVLVVDDEPLVALLTASMLEDLGHHSQVVPSGSSALSILRADKDINAVITDYAMPDMTGAELAAQIRRLRPDLPIILATGYADFPNNTAQDLPRLSKPFGAHELASILTTLHQRSLAS